MSLSLRKLILIMLSSTVLMSEAALAGDMAHRVTSKIIEGYGGQKFENLKSITINSDLRYGWMGQGHTPHFVELEQMKKIHQFDLKNHRASEEAWGQAGAYSERVFTDETGQTRINFIEGTYVQDNDAGYYDHFGGEIRSIDTMVAHELLKQRETVSYQGDKYYRGELHHIIEFDMLETSIDPVLWVNAQTGHISLMQRDIPDYAMWSYSFDDFRETKGISYAGEFVLFSDDNIIEYTKSRTIMPNRVKASTFDIEGGMSPSPEVVDSSEMSVDHISANQLSGGFFHVGQGYGYGAFVDVGEYLIALGGTGGLKKRYEAYREKHGTKPLRYLVLTHHHSDHVASAKEALELGASLIMPETAQENVEKANGSSVPDDKLMILSEDKTVIDGVEIYLTSTPHVQSYALIYVPSAKAIFQEDLYNSTFKNRAARVNQTGLTLKADIDRLGLDVDVILSGHGRKAESWTEFTVQADNPLKGACPTGRPICR